VGGSLDCDDGNACTDDSCDSSLPWGCVHVNSDGTCDDGNACTVGDHCEFSGPGSGGLIESFDQVGPPQLPAGWSSEVTPGSANGWETGATASHTPPNSATAGFQSFGEQLSLTSPAFYVDCPSQVTFRNKFDLEANYDGAVLEISIDGGSFLDIIQAGGSFVTGGYVTTISTAYGSAIGGRPAWTGDSGGFVVTSVTLPPAAVGELIQLRWRVVTDATVCGTGQFIDTVVAGFCPKTCAGFPRFCNDNNPCTFDACVPAAAGCVFTPNDGLTCSDGNPCTADACVGGVCHSGPPAGPADIGNSVRVGRSGTTAIMTWNDPPGSYNVYAGLRSSPPLTYNQTCIANSISVSTANHVPVPAAGSFYFYLVTRKDAGCGESTLGPRSSGVTRPNLNPCP
jgi:hypothetical protein